MADNVIDVPQGAIEQTEVTVADQIAESMAYSLGTAPIQTTEVVDEPQVVVQPTFEILKERFSYQSPDDAIKEIEELRQLKASHTITSSTCIGIMYHQDIHSM